MANTFDKIQTITVGAGSTTEITFSSIPQTYTDLKVLLSIRDATGTMVDQGFRVNGLGTSIYSWKRLIGSGSGTSSSSGTNTRAFYTVVNAVSSTASVFSNAEVYFPNYRSSNNKVWSSDSVSEANATLAYQNLYAGTIATTGAITSISFYCEPTGSNSFAQYTTASLYGILNT
jgi:hypothetical protein